jgi:hypothetical protein
LQFNSNKIVTVRALQLDGISLPPGKLTAELESLKAGKDIMIEPTAQTGRVMATDFKAVPDFMTGTAVSLYADYSGLHLVAETWIYSHGFLLSMSWLKMCFSFQVSGLRVACYAIDHRIIKTRNPRRATRTRTKAS